MLVVKCNYENGDYITTSINSTIEEARNYFLNRSFNIGCGENDNMQKCVSVNVIIDGEHHYHIENDPKGKGWQFEVIDNNNLLTDDILQQLKLFDGDIYFSDATVKHWIFDFKINSVWFESLEVDCVSMRIILNAYQ